MKFKELGSLPVDKYEDCIDQLLLKSLLPDTPNDVIEQFYSDHGRNNDFQEQYKDIEISKLNWNLVMLPAKDLICASVYSEFQQWFQTCVGKSQRIRMTRDWSYLHNLESICSFWEKHKTWDRPPIFFKSQLLNNQNSLHLVEGHSRLGSLKGLVLGETLLGSSIHSAWVGESK